MNKLKDLNFNERYYLNSRNTIDKFTEIFDRTSIIFLRDNLKCNSPFLSQRNELWTHRNSGPAVISNIWLHWCKNGYEHNIHGPSTINLTRMGVGMDNIKYRYKLKDVEYSKEEWEIARKEYLNPWIE